MRAVVDTNVILVANGSHDHASPDCVVVCIDRLESLMKNGRVVIDDAYRILGEYQNKTSPMKNKGPGDVFVRWLLRNNANTRHVEQVALTGPTEDVFNEFPDAALQDRIDPPDRKFLATAAAHPRRPFVWQATDSKWLDWRQPLKVAGVSVEFLCPDDVCRFYAKKFPGRAIPPLT
jgi:hypothetical protein